MPTDYMANAVAAMKSGPPAAQPPAKPVEVKVETPKPAEPKVEAPKSEAPKTEEKVEAKVEAKVDAPSDTIKQTFEKLAKDTAEFRAAKKAFEEKTKAFEAMTSALGPQGLHQLSQALASGDRLSVARALGLSQSDLVDAAGAERVEKAAKGVTPEAEKIAKLEEQLNSFIEERRREQAQAGRERAIRNLADLAKKSEYAYASEIEDAPQQAYDFIEDYVRKNNELPAETPEASLKFALDAIEERLAKQAAVFEKVLTKRKQPATVVPSESPELSTPAVREAGRTQSLTNTTSSTPAPSNPRPKTAQEFLDAATAAYRQHSS